MLQLGLQISIHIFKTNSKVGLAVSSALSRNLAPHSSKHCSHHRTMRPLLKVTLSTRSLSSVDVFPRARLHNLYASNAHHTIAFTAESLNTPSRFLIGAMLLQKRPRQFTKILCKHQGLPFGGLAHMYNHNPESSEPLTSLFPRPGSHRHRKPRNSLREIK